MLSFEVEYGKRITIPIIFKNGSDEFVDPSSFTVTIMRLENAPGFYTIIAGNNYNEISWDTSDLKNLIDCYHYGDGKYGAGFPKMDLDLRIFGSYLILVDTTDTDVADKYKHQEFFVRYYERRGLVFSFPDYTSTLTSDAADLAGLLSIGDSVYTSSIFTNYKSTDIYLGASSYPTASDDPLTFKSNGYKVEVIGVDIFSDDSYISDSTFYIVDQDDNALADGTVGTGRSGVFIELSTSYEVYYDSDTSTEKFIKIYTDTDGLTAIHTVVYYRIVIDD